MIPEIWIVVSTVCFWSSIGGKEIFVDDSVKALDYWRVGEPVETKTEPYCIQQIKISTVTVVAKKGQMVKRLCDFVGHEWRDAWVTWIEGTRATGTVGLQCQFCHKKRRKVVNETWEDVP